MKDGCKGRLTGVVTAAAVCAAGMIWLKGSLAYSLIIGMNGGVITGLSVYRYFRDRRKRDEEQRGLYPSGGLISGSISFIVALAALLGARLAGDLPGLVMLRIQILMLSAGFAAGMVGMMVQKSKIQSKKVKR